MDIFSAGRGSVAAVPSNAVPMSISVGGFSGNKTLLTGVRIEAKGGVQFLHSLRDLIYIYIFGDRIGDLHVEGISYLGCGGGHGIESVNGYYQGSKVSQTGSPVTVVLGSSVGFAGFLTGEMLHYNDPENQLSQFSLEFNVIPEDS